MPNPSLIPDLLAVLQSGPKSTPVFNPYSVHLPSVDPSHNLDVYLRALIEFPYTNDLLVGEAPGHAGCAKTGIPFTSEHVIANHPYCFIARIRPFLKCGTNQRERTATMVWNCVSSGKRPTKGPPAFWNSFPFHPHYNGQLNKNRPPSAAEIQFGATILCLVLQILTPKRVFAIGRAAESCLQKHFPSLPAPHIPHPSFGGHGDFTDGMKTHKII